MAVVSTEEAVSSVARSPLDESGEREFRAFLDLMPQLGWTARPDGATDFYNRRWYEYTGTRFEEMQGWGWKAVHDPDVLPDVVTRWEGSLRAGAPFEMEHPLRGRDGSFRWFLTRVAPITDPDGRIVRWVGYNVDIDERKRAADRSHETVRLLIESAQGNAVTRDVAAGKILADEAEARRQIEAERDQLLELTTDLIGIAAFDGYFKRLNPSWEKTLGWSAAELTGRPWLDFVHPDDVESTIAAGGKLMAGEPVAFFENRYRCKDGTYRWLDWRCVPLLAEGRIFAIARDVTPNKVAEEARAELHRRLVVADRMVSVGTLAAGVAHEINNPLSYVMANLELVLEEIRVLAGGSSSGRMKELEEIVLESLEGAERVKKIVRGLKTFSRADDERRTVMDVRPALELAINMAFNEIRHRARLVKDYGVAPLVEADDARLGQVFINLLVNAAQAIPEGNAEGNEIRIVTSTDARGRAVIEIRDTGPGIPEAMRSRIFEPFFTTKSVGVGTGLGLSICHNIITGMHGEITVTSREGSGTSFWVTLPAASVQQLAGADVCAKVAVPAGERATVLVVDDEPSVGIAMSRILRDHEVHVVTSVKDALEILASGKRFDVIFSDLMMPQLTGVDFYRELTLRSPRDAGRIVFATGGAFTPATAEFLEQVGNERIEKPFTARSVRDLVQRFLKK